MTNTFPLNPFRRCLKMIGPGDFEFDRDRCQGHQRCEHEQNPAGNHNIQCPFHKPLSRTQRRPLNFDQEGVYRPDHLVREDG